MRWVIYLFLKFFHSRQADSLAFQGFLLLSRQAKQRMSQRKADSPSLKGKPVVNDDDDLWVKNKIKLTVHPNVQISDSTVIRPPCNASGGRKFLAGYNVWALPTCRAKISPFNK